MNSKKQIRCAVYTRKSTEHNLDLEFNSLDAQREACEAYIRSQIHEGWRLVPARYDDGGISVTCPALFVPSELIEIGLERSLEMRKKRPTPEQIVTLLRQIEVATSQGKSIAIACREAGISDQSYYRWRKEYGGLDLDQARRMKDLEKENSRLKRLVADLSLEKQVLKDIASGNL